MSAVPLHLSRRQQDSLLLEIDRRARFHAAFFVKSHLREDVVQNVNLDCLVRLREHRWAIAAEGLDRYVMIKVWSGRNTAYRARIRERRRDAAHLREIGGAPREWMAQELLQEEERLRDLARHVLGGFPRKWRRAYLLVREEGLSYRQTAARVGLSSAAVHKYVSSIQGTFRRVLAVEQIETRETTRGGRLRAASGW
jgi:DNA-directed RNA polymerase specialized sigma24 family protein